MAIQTQAHTRSFNNNGLDLPDPGSEMSPGDVRDLFSATYPELANAEIVGPEVRGDRLAYTFRRAAGTKG